MDEINKYRRIISFHYKHFEDQNLSGDKHHITVCHLLLSEHFIKYGDYARYCTVLDIAAVSEQRWKKEIIEGN